MNAIKFRLLATIITLAAVTTAITTSTAQRRSTGSNRVESRKQAPERTTNKSAVTRKSPVKNSDKVQSKSSSRRVNSGRQVKQQTTGSTSANMRQKSESVNTPRSTGRSSSANRSVNRRSTNRDNSSSGRTTVRNNPVKQNPVRTKSGQTNRNTGKLRSSSTQSSKTIANSGRRATGSADLRTMARSTDSRTKYYHNNNDKRYTPSRDYRGSKNSWSNHNRSSRMDYNRSDSRFYHNYNPNKSRHWNRSWERYRWNHRSWLDYYHGYNPYSYRYNRHYYRHHRYGHVVREFVYAPQVFIHNHHRYYSYDGHFFRFLRGVGYVLIDVPFGLTFDYLPHGYEQVFINGYLYFRVGNLFFEHTNFGFQLVHYPERYFAYDDGFSNNGYYFDDYY